MTPDAARGAPLVRALHASIEHDRGAAGDLYTEDMRAWTPAMSTASLSELMDEFERRDAPSPGDMRAWTPAMSTASLSELMDEFERRDDAFSDIELEVSPLDVGGEY